MKASQIYKRKKATVTFQIEWSYLSSDCTHCHDDGVCSQGKVKWSQTGFV